MTGKTGGRETSSSAIKSLVKAGFLALPRRTRIGIMRALGRRSPWEPGVILEPPPCPDGMVTGPPDFVGVGVQKAGTSWWYALLCQHEDIYHPQGVPKERHFFMRFFEGDMGPDAVAEYQRWFPRPPGRLTGEWTPDYMASFWVPPLLAAAAPQAKILVLLRDPVDRWVSGLTHRGRLERVLDWRGAVDAFSKGRYLEQLSWLRQHYPEQQLLVLQYERCQRDASAQLMQTLRFLGLTEPVVLPSLRSPVNQTQERKVLLHPHVQRQLVRLYSAEVTALADTYPDIDLTLWPNFAHLA